MPEYKTISTTINCDYSNKTCYVDLTYQKINRCGTTAIRGKIANFNCPNNNQCPTDQCPIYSQKDITTAW